MTKKVKDMNKFSIKTSATINVPESFRKDLLELCNMAEEDYRLDFCNIIDTIIEAPANEDKWCNHDSSIIINFYEDEK